MTTQFDRRRHPVRKDLAARAYEGRVEADRFVDGYKKIIATSVLDFRKDPRSDQSIDTQGLFGEVVTVFEEASDGWAWVQLETDGYVGWVSADALADPVEPTHRVTALNSFCYSGPDLKLPRVGALSIGSRIRVIGEKTTRDLLYFQLSDHSYVVARHVASLSEPGHQDWVAVAEQFLNVPYLWGGRSGAGLDCSALVQLALAEGGVEIPRDSDMQEAEIGHLLPLDTPLKSLTRGDLIFWKGHVGIVQGQNQLLHANGHTMTVASEALDEAVRRIGENEFGAVTAIKRLS